jgi:hypothetical protein
MYKEAWSNTDGSNNFLKVNELLDEGWEPVRESPMGGGGNTAIVSSIVLLRRKKVR